jgi:hypothetical protein
MIAAAKRESQGRKETAQHHEGIALELLSLFL